VDEDVRQYVLFRIGREEYGLPIEQVSSIIRYEEPTPVPRAPEDVLGVINMRGMVVPVVDLKHRFTGAVDEETPFDRIVVTESDVGSVGLAVDAATEVATFPVEEIREAPETALSADTAEAFEGVASLDDRLVILLRLEKAIPYETYVHVVSPEEERDG
jgi:purine-binding chemotaxis protein CheW